MSRGRWIHRSDIHRKGQREDLDVGAILRCGFNALENVTMTTEAPAATGAGWGGFFCTVRIPVMHSQGTQPSATPAAHDWLGGEQTLPSHSLMPANFGVLGKSLSLWVPQ